MFIFKTKNMIIDIDLAYPLANAEMIVIGYAVTDSVRSAAATFKIK